MSASPSCQLLDHEVGARGVEALGLQVPCGRPEFEFVAPTREVSVPTIQQLVRKGRQAKRYKSKTPYNVISGVDTNLDGLIYDLPAGVSTLNSARGASFKQFDLRVAKSIMVAKKRFELLAEGFNVTNEKNPAGFVANQRASNFGQPTAYAGDFQRGEQRLFQLGVRFEF